MKITSAEFVKGVVGEDPILEDTLPKYAFIGRSNVGKSSLINTLVNKKALAVTSSFPGRTKQLNVFLVNKKIHFIDLPGYGFSKGSHESRSQILNLINWYLFLSKYQQNKVILIIDAYVGPTEDDLEMLYSLRGAKKNIIVVANKIDKVKKSQLKSQLEKIQATIGPITVIPYSAEEKIGIKELMSEILL